MNQQATPLIVAATGTVAAAGFAPLSEVATIAAGFATAVYGLSWAAIAWLRYFKRRDDSATDNRRP